MPIVNRRPELDLCPEFDDENYEAIIDWAAKEFQAKVTWDDLVYCGRTKATTHRPDLAMWGLSWSYGCIGFSHLRDINDEEKARKEAALFIYLWSLGVPASLATHMATAYVEDASGDWPWCDACRSYHHPDSPTCKLKEPTG